MPKLEIATFAWSQIEFEGWQNTPKGNLSINRVKISFFFHLDTDISIFHENKAYIAPKHPFSVDQDFTIQELDLGKINIFLISLLIDSKTCKEINIPKPPTQDSNSTFCHQLINGKFYICTGRDKHGELWFYDLSTPMNPFYFLIFSKKTLIPTSSGLQSR